MPGRPTTICIALLLAPALSACGAPGRARAGPVTIAGSMLVTLEDADAPPTVFLDGALAGREPFARDTLTAVRLPLPDARPGAPAAGEYAQALAPSSLLGSPASLAVSPDGAWAAAAALRDGALDIHERLDDLAPLSRIALFDLRAWPPRETDATDACAEPRSVSIHPRGTSLCAVSAATGELVVIGVSGGRFREVVRIPLRGALGIESTPTSAHWSPDGRTIALCLGAGGVAFAEVDLTVVATPGVRLVGGPVEAGRFARTGVWTPDGRAFLALDTGWIDDERGWGALANAGGVHLIAPDGGVRASAAIAGNPHAIALRPDGSRAVVTGLAKGDPAEPDATLRRGGALTLLRVARGSLDVLARARCGSLPMDVAFDATGDHALVADFATGRVEVFRVRGRRIEFTGVRVETNYGVHQVRVAP